MDLFGSAAALGLSEVLTAPAFGGKVATLLIRGGLPLQFPSRMRQLIHNPEYGLTFQSIQIRNWCGNTETFVHVDREWKVGRDDTVLLVANELLGASVLHYS